MRCTIAVAVVMGVGVSMPHFLEQLIMMTLSDLLMELFVLVLHLLHLLLYYYTITKGNTPKQMQIHRSIDANLEYI